jgi:multidrug efflux pump subunit AcrA (membrane-fusion protein)
MAIARAVNLRVRPLQSVDLNFPVDGIVGAQSDIHLLGKSVQAFDLSTLYSVLGAVVTPRAANIGPQHGEILQQPPLLPASDQPFGWGRLKYDCSTIRSELGEYVLFELRAEHIRAAVDKAIAQRENAWVQKFEKNVYAATLNAYDRSDPNGRLGRLQRLAAISQVQHDRLRTEYDADLNSVNIAGVVSHGVVKVASMTDTTNSRPVHTRSQGSESVQDWQGNMIPSQSVQSASRGYDYRHPSLENDAQFERAQVSLLDEQLAAMSTTNYVCGSEVEQAIAARGDRRYFANDLLAIDLDVKRLQVAYIDTLLISPIDGVVTGVFRNVGDGVRAGQAVVRVENDIEILLVGTVKFRGLLRIGQTVSVTTQVFGSDQSLSISGQVAAVRGHDSEDELWDVIVRCNNRDDTGASIFPINYNFDFDNTHVDVA